MSGLDGCTALLFMTRRLTLNCDRDRLRGRGVQKRLRGDGPRASGTSVNAPRAQYRCPQDALTPRTDRSDIRRHFDARPFNRVSSSTDSMGFSATPIVS